MYEGARISTRCTLGVSSERLGLFSVFGLHLKIELMVLNLALPCKPIVCCEDLTISSLCGPICND